MVLHFLLSFYICSLASFYKDELPPIYWIIDVIMDSCIFILWVIINIQLSLRFFHLQPLGALLVWNLFSFWYAPTLFKHSFIFTTKCFRFNLYLACTVFESTVSSSVPDSFYGRKVFRNQDLGTRCAHCY